MNLYFVIILFVVLIIWITIHNLRKKEGIIFNMCSDKCSSVEDCSGIDMSYCLVDIPETTPGVIPEWKEPRKKKSELESCPEPVPAEPIKCIADFGTSVGDPLCCGQDGVLQDTRYVCPNTMKKCQNFKCGSAFGTCVSE